MVVSGLLEVAAIVPDAGVHVAAHEFASQCVPAGGPGKSREQASDGMKRDCLPEQMRVGGKVDRQVVFEVKSVAIELSKKSSAERFGHLRAEEVPDPYPRQCAERDLKRTGPVDAALVGVFRPPVFQLTDHRIEVFASPGGNVGLREQDQMLVAVDLPDKLVVPGRRQVEIGNPAEVFRRRLGAASRIAAPRDGSAVVDYAIEYGNVTLYDFVGELFQLARITAVAQPGC